MAQGLIGLSSVIAGPGLIAFVVAQMGDLLGPNRGSLLWPTLAAYASSATVYLTMAAVNFVIAMTLIGPALLTDPYAAVNSPNTELVEAVFWGSSVNHGHVPHCGLVASPPVHESAPSSKSPGFEVIRHTHQSERFWLNAAAS